jgi:hypothetical protein
LCNFDFDVITRSVDLDIIKDLCSDNYYIESNMDKRLRIVGRLYEESFKKISSTVPYISFKDNEYEVEVVDKYDQEILKAFKNSNFKVGCLGNDFLHYVVLNKNGFKIVIRKNKEIIARILGVRNGNTLYLNKIEGIKDENYENLLRQLGERVINFTKSTNEPIEFVIIVNNDLLDSKNGLRVDNVVFPVIDNPINTMYADYDDYKARNDFLFSHNLISYEHRLEYNDACFVNYNKKKCDEIVNKIAKITSNINYYNYLEECEIPKTDEGEVDYYSNYFLKNSFAFKNLKSKQREMKSFKLKTFLSEEESNDNETLHVPCVDDGPIRKYFNRDDVKEALHVNKSKTWDLCSYSVYFSYYMQDKASIWAYQTLFENNIRILIFNGDVDIVVSYFGNQRWIEALGLEVLEPWRQWRAFEDKVNVSGYVEKYKGLTFCTIKGAGHECLRYKPKEAYYMFTKFLNNEDL